MTAPTATPRRTAAAELPIDPHARLSMALVLSLVLWTPFGLAAFRGELDLTQAGLRYVVAFLGCRLAVGGIAHLVGAYHHTPAPEELGQP